MKVEHNGIKLTHNIDRSLVEIDTSINGVTTDYQFVILCATLQDYLKYKNIRYFVLTKKTMTLNYHTTIIIIVKQF